MSFGGTFAVFGHCFPVYLGFRGGKGVATGCGAIVALDPLVFVAGGLVWLAVLGASRFVSLASIGMGIAFPDRRLVAPSERAAVLGRRDPVDALDPRAASREHSPG